MAFTDTSRDFEQAVQQYLDHIRRGGTPPFASSPAWEEAQRRAKNPATMMLEILLQQGRLGPPNMNPNRSMGVVDPTSAQQFMRNLGVLK